MSLVVKGLFWAPTMKYLYYRTQKEESLIFHTFMHMHSHSSDQEGVQGSGLNFVVEVEYCQQHESSTPLDGQVIQITVFFQIKRKIQSSERNSILGIYGWIQLSASRQ